MLTFILIFGKIILYNNRINNGFLKTVEECNTFFLHTLKDIFLNNLLYDMYIFLKLYRDQTSTPTSPTPLRVIILYVIYKCLHIEQTSN